MSCSAAYILFFIRRTTRQLHDRETISRRLQPPDALATPRSLCLLRRRRLHVRAIPRRRSSATRRFQDTLARRLHDASASRPVAAFALPLSPYSLDCPIRWLSSALAIGTYLVCPNHWPLPRLPYPLALALSTLPPGPCPVCLNYWFLSLLLGPPQILTSSPLPSTPDPLSYIYTFSPFPFSFLSPASRPLPLPPFPLVPFPLVILSLSLPTTPFPLHPGPCHFPLGRLPSLPCLLALAPLPSLPCHCPLSLLPLGP